jgi:hypothetical protein
MVGDPTGTVRRRDFPCRKAASRHWPLGADSGSQRCRGFCALTVRTVPAQLEKLIPGPRIPMKSPQMTTLTINQKALNGIRPSPTP